jgi:hypothetical protein
MNINQNEITKVCKLISGDTNFFLTQSQMIDVLSENPALLDAVNDGALSGLFVPNNNNILLVDFNNPELYSLGKAPDVIYSACLISFIQKQIFNQFFMSLLGKPVPSQDEMDDMDFDEADAYFAEITNQGLAKGYVYSSHPDGPQGDSC